jgi:hypothetical protein
MLLLKQPEPSLTVQNPPSGSQINKDGPLNVVGIATGLAADFLLNLIAYNLIRIPKLLTA